MNKVLDIAAKALSILLYPLFIPTYGIILFCVAFSHHVQPLLPVWPIVAISGTLLLTCLLPITAIWLLMKRGKVQDLYIDNAGERTVPYMYAVLGFGFWCYLLIAILHAPLYLCCVAIGATVAIGLIALINRTWKISAHLTGLGGFVGGLMSYYVGVGLFPSTWMLVLCLVLSLLLMCARLRVNAHTPEQVCAGWLLGITCTLLPYCVISYVV